jgi:hypothetical protein
MEFESLPALQLPARGRQVRELEGSKFQANAPALYIVGFTRQEKALAALPVLWRAHSPGLCHFLIITPLP